MKTGLVLEGGGMRGLFTVGVLDAFLDAGISFDYVIGVSAGACNAASFISRQRERSLRINTNYIGDPRYLSLQNFIKTRSLFGMDFLFNTIPNELEPFDMETYKNSPTELKIVVTDVRTGKPYYFDKLPGDGSPRDLCKVLEASSSIPVMSPIVDFYGGRYLDGGASDPIPLQRALDDGCDHIVVVQTRDRSYIKKPESMRIVYRWVFKKYPRMADCLSRRHIIYNTTAAAAKKMDAHGKIILLAPAEPLKVERFEKDAGKLREVYALGFAQATSEAERIAQYLAH